MALSGRLVLLALLGVVLAGYSGAVLAAYAALLILVAAADLLLAAPIAGLRLHRESSDAVRLGEAGATTLRIANSSRRRLRARVRDAWVPSAGALPREQTITVAPGERRTVRTSLRPTRRGERRAALVTIRSFGPLGVAARQRKLAVAGSIAVLPSFASRKFLPEKLARLRQIDGAVLVRQRGQGSEFDSLREYVVGDDVRAIDWRATARAGNVVVRTWRPERDRHIVFAIDTGRTSAARIGDEPRLDAALDACLLLAAVAARAGDRVALVAADVAVRARLGLTAGHDILPTLVNTVLGIEPALVETDPNLLATEVIRAAGKRSLVVLFTGLDGGAVDTGLMPAARSLAARHQLVVASVADPRLAELARTRDDAGDVYTAAAAELSGIQRRDVAERLGRLGAEIVDAPPDRFASKVADAYLNLKAAGRL
jgi:uncharacterized protein (DUF58 family)